MPDAAREEIVDVVFRLPGGRLPVDHAYALFRAVSGALPWFADEAAARLHLVHTAASGSGWMCPQDTASDELHLSRRTKLRLRVPRNRAEDARALCGTDMDIDGYSITPGSAKVNALVPAGTLLARHVICEEHEEESRFVARLTAMLRTHRLSGISLICGRAHRIATPASVLHTRSLVVTNLEPGGAMFLLQNGVGAGGKLGCGVFVPYKHVPGY